MADTSLSLNLKQVIKNLETHPDLTTNQKKTYIQSIEKVCAWLGLEPERVTARRVELRPAIEKLNASQLGVKQKTLQNRVSSFNSALRYGADGAYYQAATQPNQAWLALLDDIAVAWRRQKIGQLAQYCSTHAIGPADVTAETFAEWMVWRQEHAPLLTKPERAVEDAWSCWNWCAAHIENWPTGKIDRPSRKKFVRLDRDTLPVSLAAELDGYEAHMVRDKDDDLLVGESDDPVNAVTPTVARNRILAIEMCASALVDLGQKDPEELKSISEIVSAEHALKLVNWVKARNGGEYTHYHRSLLEHLRAVAAQYIGFENMAEGEKELAKFNHMIKVVSDKVGHGKMTKTNKSRLSQFDNPENVARIVNLPTKVFYNLETRRQKSGFVTCQMAYDARAALAVLIELTLPLRRANLVDMRIGKELMLPSSKRDIARIVIEGAEVKNDQDLTCAVPDHAYELILTYLKWYRPVLIAAKKSDAPDGMRYGDGDHYLFPVKGGNPIDGGKLRQKVVTLVNKETGLDVTLHFFRHFAGSMIMKMDPALASAAGAILGHKDGSRVTRVYAKVSSERAADTFEEVKEALSKPKLRKTRKMRVQRVRRSHVS